PRSRPGERRTTRCEGIPRKIRAAALGIEPIRGRTGTNTRCGPSAARGSHEHSSVFPPPTTAVSRGGLLRVVALVCGWLRRRIPGSDRFWRERRLRDRRRNLERGDERYWERRRGDGRVRDRRRGDGRQRLRGKERRRIRRNQ